MSSYAQRLSFMKQYMTYTEMSELTGIPRSTLNYVVRGVRDLSQQYRPLVEPAYRKTAYHALRDAGFSSYQANRWKWYSPSRVMEVMQDVATHTAYLARGTALKQWVAYQRRGIEVDWDSLYADALQKQQYAYEHSDMSAEEYKELEHGKTS